MNAAVAAFIVGVMSTAPALSGQDPAEPPQGKPSGKVLAPPAGAIPRKSVDEKALRATVEELAACGTRHSLSSWEDPKRGIGCGRDKILARLTEIARESGGRLSVTVDRFEATAPRTREKPARLENVLAFLPGSDPKLAKTVFLVSGHFDSMPSSVMDPEADAPGADDDASGTAVSIECARLLSKGSYRATLLFAAVSGEEQGLLGGKRLLEYLKEKGYQIGGFLNNDIVGADFAPGGPHRVRIFSGGGPDGVDSPSRDLAR
ncbi:MAG TPA: M28 family peptidase, partial [Thermoanaerobaculia bacterium]